MTEEINIFFLFFVLGGGIGVLFFAGKYLASKVKKRNRQVAVETVLLVLLFCLYGVLFFILLLGCNFGVFRFYMVFASIAGFGLSNLFAIISKKLYTKYHGTK